MTQQEQTEQEQTEVDDRDTFEIVADRLYKAGIGVGKGWEDRFYTCTVEGCKGGEKGTPFSSPAMYWLEREGRYVPKTVRYGGMQGNGRSRRRSMFAIGINVAEPLTLDGKPNLACAFHAREALRNAIKAAGGKPQPDLYVSFGAVLRELWNIERAGGVGERGVERGQNELVLDLVERRMEESNACIHCGREHKKGDTFCPERKTLEGLIDELTQEVERREVTEDHPLARRLGLLVGFYDKHFGNATAATLVTICDEPRSPKCEGGKQVESCLCSFVRMATGTLRFDRQGRLNDRVKVGGRLWRLVVPTAEILKRQARSALRRAEEDFRAETAVSEWEESTGMGVTISDIVTEKDLETRRGDRRGNQSSCRQTARDVERNSNNAWRAFAAVGRGGDSDSDI